MMQKCKVTKSLTSKLSSPALMDTFSGEDHCCSLNYKSSTLSGEDHIKYMTLIRKYSSLSLIVIFFLNIEYSIAKEKNKIEIGFEHTELAQNEYRDLGSSNYTFFIGKRFESEKLKNWAWRLSLINVELSNEHLRDEDRVCCIDGDRSNLEGELEQHRLYLTYRPIILDWASENENIRTELIPGFSVGYNRQVTRDVLLNDEHDVKALTIGGLLSFKTTFYKQLFIEPAIDIGYIVYKNKNINDTVGSAVLDRPEEYTFTFLVYMGFVF